MSFAFEETPRISLICKLVPGQCREYEYGPLQTRIKILKYLSEEIKNCSFTQMHFTCKKRTLKPHFYKVNRNRELA